LFKTAADAVQAIDAAYEPLVFNKANNNFNQVFGGAAPDFMDWNFEIKRITL
jgi:hypothetical protein